MVARFPENKDITSVYYNLYLLYLQTGNVAKAETYKQLVLQNPSSAFAMVISDPDYLKRDEAKKNELNNYYASTYDYYVQENYKDVMKRVRAADSLFKPNPLQPKFELLEAMVTGKTLGRTQYIAALEAIVKNILPEKCMIKQLKFLPHWGWQWHNPLLNKLNPQTTKAGRQPKLLTWCIRATRIILW